MPLKSTRGENLKQNEARYFARARKAALSALSARNFLQKILAEVSILPIQPILCFGCANQ